MSSNHFPLNISETLKKKVAVANAGVCVSLKVFFVVLIGAFTVGQTSPNIQNFASARGAAHKVYSIIDHVSDATFFPKAHMLKMWFFLDIFAAGQLSLCITEHAPL